MTMNHFERTILAVAASALLSAAGPLAAGDAVAQGRTGTVAGTVELQRKGSPRRDHSDVVVYLEGARAAKASASEGQEVRQRNLTFVPALTVVTVGTEVSFPNDDRVFHNVFSMSRGNRFDLGLYRAGSAKSVTFNRPGVVDVYCNIHPQMVAVIKVLDTDHYAVTGADGRFRIANVPPGTYTLVAWQRHGRAHRGQVTVTAGGRTEVNLELEQGSRPRRHLRKDGTPYGRYE
jgi:plastocyanin